MASKAPSPRWSPRATLSALSLLLLAGHAAGKPICPGDAPDPPFDAAKAWDEARTELAANYAYWDRIDAAAAFDAAAASMRKAPDRLAFAERLQTLLLLFRDSHLHVTPTPSPGAAWVPSAADMWFEQRDGRFFVRDVKGHTVAAGQGVRPGWELVAMDGAEPATTVRARFAALGLKADAAQMLYAVNALASGTLGRPRRFTFRVDGQTREITLPPGYDSVARPPGPLQVTTLHDAAGHLVAVLRVANSLGDDALIGAFDRAVAALPARAHVVIDLRDTPSGGNSTVARAMMSHFVDRPMPYQRHELTAERVQYGVARSWVEYVEPRTPYRRDKPIVLAGLWTGSMGEGITIGLDAAAGATVIGSAMGHLLGAMTESELPASCLKLSLATEKLWHVNGTPREDFLPAILLPTADTAPDGSDPALHRAIAELDRREEVHR